MAHLRIVIVSVVAAVGACSSSGGGLAPSGKGPGLGGGSEALSLLPAPPGLCSGDGTKKECAEPGGCAPGAGVGGSSPGGGTGGSGVGGGFGGSAGGGPDQGSAGAAGSSEAAGAGGSSGSGTAGVSGSSAGPGGFGGSSGVAGASGSSSSVGGSAGTAASDAGCVPDADGGLPPECRDAGAGAPMARTLPPQALESSCASLERKPYTLYLSADDSNSTASPVIARRLIRLGGVVPASIVRPYEFLNYYDFSFEPAERGEVRIVPQLSSCPTDGELSFQVALQSEARDPDDRPPLNVTFVLDTSGSMMGYSRTDARPIDLERAAVLAIASRLRRGDVVSMVTWSTDQKDILAAHVVTGPDDPVIVDAANALEASGGTDLHAGLVRGYAMAEQAYSRDRINRVVLISDGQANVGVVDEELIGSYADDEEGDAGIYLAGIGVGDGVNDTLMNAVTDAGRGAYVYLDSDAEAHKMLGDRFLTVVDLAARSVRLEVTLPWYMNVTKFFGEEISTDPTKVRPQHLGPNDAMLFFQILRACDASLLRGDDRIRLRATWETPFPRQNREAVIDATLNALAGDDAELTKAAAIAGYAEALIAVSGGAGAPALDEALRNVRAARGAGTDPDLVEVEALLVQYRAHVGGG